jgi:hypothetical protein
MDFKEIKYLHDNYPDKIRGIYHRYGIKKAPLSMQTTKDLHTIYGERFEGEVLNECYPDSFLGITKEKLKNFGGKALNVINAYRDNRGPATPTDGSPTPDDGKIMGIDKTLFFGICAVALILIVYAISQHKKQAAV